MESEDGVGYQEGHDEQGIYIDGAEHRKEVTWGRGSS
jgi:hypothetical protein